MARLVARERPDALRREDVAVPDDLAVTGLEGIPFAAISNPRLTTVIQPPDLLGETAAGVLFDAIENGTPPPDITLPVTLAIRGSSRRRVAERGAGVVVSQAKS